MRTASSVLLGLFVAYLAGFLAVAALFVLLLVVTEGRFNVTAGDTRTDVIGLLAIALYAVGAAGGFVLCWRLTSTWRRRSAAAA